MAAIPVAARTRLTGREAVVHEGAELGVVGVAERAPGPGDGLALAAFAPSRPDLGELAIDRHLPGEFEVVVDDGLRGVLPGVPP